MVGMASFTYDSEAQRRFWRILPDLVRARELILDLVSKDLRARYRYALMGFLWALLEPVALMLVLTFVFGFVLGGRGGIDQGLSGRQFAVVLLCKLVFWQFTANAVAAAVRSLLDNQNLVKKVYFTREVVPLAALGYPLVNLGIGLVLLLAVHLAFGGALGASLMLVPVVFGIQFALTAGLALLLSCGNVLYRDIGYITGVALLFGFYASPVFYPVELVINAESIPAWGKLLYLANPMAGLLSAYRAIIVDAVLPAWWMVVWPGVCAALALFCGAWVFRRVAPDLSDHL